MDYPTKTMVESFCNGAFTQKIADQAWTYLEEVTENTLQWAPIKQKPKKQTITKRGGIHKIELKLEAEAKSATVMKWLEALEINSGIQRPTPDTLESLKCSQAIGGTTESPTWGHAEIPLKKRVWCIRTPDSIIGSGMTLIPTPTIRVGKRTQTFLGQKVHSRRAHLRPCHLNDFKNSYRTSAQSTKTAGRLS